MQAYIKPTQICENPYLAAHRQKYVKFNGVDSVCKILLCGVPQGSVLGPLLFIWYINVIAHVSNLLSSVLFADDTNIFASDYDIVVLCMNINNELIKLNMWFEINKLSLNVSKTDYIILSKNKTNHYAIRINIYGIVCY